MTRATSVVATGDVLPRPNGSSIRLRSRTVGPVTGRKKPSRKTVGRMVTTGRPDQEPPARQASAAVAAGSVVVFSMLIWETVILRHIDQSFHSESFPRNGWCHGHGCLEVTGRRGHAEVDSPTALDDPIDIGGFEQVTDHHLGAGGPQRCRTIILATHHGANRKSAIEEQAAHDSPDGPKFTRCSSYEDRSLCATDFLAFANSRVLSPLCRLPSTD